MSGVLQLYAASNSSRATASLIINTNTQNAVVNVSTLTNYVAGKTDITITVNSGVYVYGQSPQVPATVYELSLTKPVASLEIIGGTTGDKINIINNGYILGYGGDGAGLIEYYLSCSSSVTFNTPTQGGAAIATTYPINSIVNTGYIAGGGGGGGTTGQFAYGAGGGGGAGGGISFSTTVYTSGGSAYVQPRVYPPTLTGNNGIVFSQGYGCCQTFIYMVGGGGGYDLPGTGGNIGTIGTFYNYGRGGSAGGSGAATGNIGVVTTNYGGSGNNPAGPSTDSSANSNYGGGGGGWASSGGNATVGNGLIQAGAVGGYAIITNGNAVSAPTGSGTVYGTTNTTLRSVAYTFTSSSDYQTFSLDTIPGMASGTDVILVVPANVKLYSSDATYPALTLIYSTYTPNSVRVIVNGSITGMGGYGGGNSISAAGNGGDAIALGTATYVYNATTIFDCTNGYIAGGGGGGGETSSASGNDLYGGGGAGGGSSGFVGSPAYNPGATPGTSASGNNGYYASGTGHYSGGSGGTILPGTRTTNTVGTVGVSYPGLGGQAGGAGAFQQFSTVVLNYGGAFKENGGQSRGLGRYYAGGGGGWGGNGGNGYRSTILNQTGAAGGYAVRKYSTSAAQMFIVNTNNIAGTIV